MNKFANGDWNQFSTFLRLHPSSFNSLQCLSKKILQRFIQENLLKTIKKLFYVLKKRIGKKKFFKSEAEREFV
jgi:hypothetical protein